MFFLLEPMTQRWKFCALMVLTVISVGAAGCGKQAPPPKVAFANSLFRILDINIPPGATLEHSYPSGAAIVVMTDGGRIRLRPSGKDWGGEITPHPGNITVAEPGAHSVQNVGDAPVQLLALENLRPNSGSTAAAMVANGTTLAGESASLRAYDAQ